MKLYVVSRSIIKFSLTLKVLQPWFLTNSLGVFNVSFSPLNTLNSNSAWCFFISPVCDSSSIISTVFKFSYFYEIKFMQLPKLTCSSISISSTIFKGCSKSMYPLMEEWMRGKGGGIVNLTLRTFWITILVLSMKTLDGTEVNNNLRSESFVE